MLCFWWGSRGNLELSLLGVKGLMLICVPKSQNKQRYSKSNWIFRRSLSWVCMTPRKYVFDGRGGTMFVSFSSRSMSTATHVTLDLKVAYQAKQTEYTPYFAKMAKSIPYFRLEMLENDTLWGGTYLYGLYMGVPHPPPPPPGFCGSPCTVPEYLIYTR